MTQRNRNNPVRRYQAGERIPSHARFIKLAWNEVLLGEPFNYDLVDHLDRANALNYERWRLNATNAIAAGLHLRLWEGNTYPAHVKLAVNQAADLVGSCNPGSRKRGPEIQASLT